jgi:hypothetical protein
MQPEEFLRLKKRLEELRREHDQAVGAHKEAIKRLKQNHHCSTMKEANDKIERLDAERKEMLSVRERLIQEFEQKWGEQLEELA